jgi:hypothetical protein
MRLELITWDEGDAGQMVEFLHSTSSNSTNWPASPQPLIRLVSLSCFPLDFDQRQGGDRARAYRDSVHCPSCEWLLNQFYFKTVSAAFA